MDNEIKKVLVTGSAGFIGFHLSKKLLDNNIEVVGLDNINPYYDPDLKKARLVQLTPNSSYSHVNLDLSDRVAIAELFSTHSFDDIKNLPVRL